VKCDCLSYLLVTAIFVLAALLKQLIFCHISWSLSLICLQQLKQLVD